MSADVRIGNILLGTNPVALAPMAGTSSVTYRGICHEYGAVYSPTELCSARSIIYNGIEKSYRFLEIDPDAEGITCIQLFGNDPEDFAGAIHKIHEHPVLSQVSIIDINMGCPVSKVIKTGAGSALMKTPDLAKKIVSSSVEAASRYGKPVTVKTRIGYTEFSDSSIKFVEGLCEAGAAMICIHGRTQLQMYHGNADIEAIRMLSQAVREKNVPFFANGDIDSIEAAQRMYDVTDCDGIMVGRAAQGNPWIFREIANGIREDVSVEEKMSVMMRELTGTAAHIGESTAVKEMRSVMPNYIKGLHGAAKIKVALCSCSTIDDVRRVIDDAFTMWREDGQN